MLATAQQEQAHFIVNGVSDSTDAPNLLSNVVMMPEGKNTLLRTQNMKCKTAVVGKALNTLKGSKAPAQVDVMQAISALAGNLEKDPSKQPVDVVFLTPLDAHAGGVNLRDPKTLADPVRAINKLASQGLIPSCKNYRVYAVSPNGDLNDVQAAQLKTFWQTYATKCGGKIVAWAPHLGTFPVTTAIGVADTSVIQVEKSLEAVTASLSSDVLFAPDSAMLLDSAGPALGDLLELTNESAGKIVITGHIDPTGSGVTEAGMALSLQRATTVKDWLVAHNVDGSRISVIGRVPPTPSIPTRRPTRRRPPTRASSPSSTRRADP